MTIFLRALEYVDKQDALQTAIHSTDSKGSRRFIVDPSTFSAIPGSPFAYWAGGKVLNTFFEFDRFEGNGRVARRGVNTNDDFRFLRASWECPDRGKWLPHIKGGTYSPFYADPHIVLNWAGEGRELEAERVTTRVYKSAILPSRDLYRRPGLAWPRRTKSRLSFRVMPAGCIFGDKGPAAFMDGDEPSDLLAMLAVTSSEVFHSLVELQLAAADAKPGGAAHSFEVGVIQNTPLALPADKDDLSLLSELARRAWALSRRLDEVIETSHAFVLPAVVLRRLKPFDPGSLAAEITSIRTDIERETLRLYRLNTADCAKIRAEAPEVAPDDGEDDDSIEIAAEENSLLLSWCVGVAFGRFDRDLATGVRALPPEPEPFDPLPCSSPAVTGSAVAAQPRPCRDILVDDPGHADDLCSLVVNVLGEIDFHQEANLGDAKVRRWLAREFWPLHLRMYSKSRRRAPIYWQMAAASTNYSVWLYIHELTKDTLYRVENDYVGPKLTHERRQLDAVRSEAGPNPSASQRRTIEGQEALVDELYALNAEVKRVAPLWNPNLDDGVLINFAPLWRLAAYSKAWQKEVKATWDAVCAGEYDWAHLAMHLWPERVVPKCASDRSLAIAHDLEEVFWVEAESGKWKARSTPTIPLEELVRERTSETVKAALKDLLDAPEPAGAARRARRSA